MTDENKNKPDIKEENLEDEWMIRSREIYEDEYSDCTSIKGRFYQYFVDGKMTDCSQWKRDADNCVRWTEKHDLNAAKRVIESERARRLNRMRDHYGNNVWTKRKEPPEDWNKPLPEYLQKEYENTYLNIKSKEMKGEIQPSFDTSTSFNCSIM